MNRNELCESLEWLETLMRRAKVGHMSETTWGFLFARLKQARELAEQLADQRKTVGL